MFNRYYNQSCVYEKFSEIRDRWSNTNYEAPRVLKCLKYGEDQYIRGEESSEVKRVIVYQTLEKVVVKDKVDGHVVTASTPYFDLNGKYMYTEFFL